jgi:hypothetical protein
VEVVEADATAELPQNVDALPQRGAAKLRTTTAEPRTTVARQLETEDDLSVRDWLDGFAADSEIKVQITRKKPLLGPHGEQISGSLETVEGRVDEDYIRETWGGGEFSLKVYTPRGPAGSFKYFRGRTIKLAGPPKMHGAPLMGNNTAQVVAHEEDTLATRAFETMERNAERAQQRADRMEQMGNRSSGLDVDALRTLNQPFVAQMQQAQQTIAHLQSQLITLSGKEPPRDEFRDKLLERALEGESARIEALRAQYENRIDKLKDSHEDQIKRMEDRHNDDIKRMESRHEREIKNAERVLDAQSKGVDQAFQARLESLKEQNARLERELATGAAKIGALEARKDQSVGEKAEELIKIKEALDGIGGGKDDKEEAWYEKLIGTVGSLPGVTAAIEKLAGGAPTQPGPQQPQQPQLPPPGIPFSNGDGNVYVHDGNGNVQIVDQAALRQQRALAGARKRKRVAADAPTGVVDEALAGNDEEPVGRPPNAQEMRIAINFMENAIKAGATPEQFGQTARNLIPSDILVYMQHVGIEKFLQSARLEQGSPLTSIRGRQFARSVAKFLSEGEVEAPPAAAELEEPAQEG